MKTVERLEDMTGRGRLRLVQQENGAIVVTAQPECNGVLQMGASVGFQTIGDGGGKSPKTMAALRALIVAMEDDNAAYPFGDPNFGVHGR